jgi:hypothetical protein
MICQNWLRLQSITYCESHESYIPRLFIVHSHASPLAATRPNKEHARYFENLVVNFFLILDCEAIGTAATPGLLCQPRVIMKMIVEK